MNQINIDLNAPFEKTLATVLSLPDGGNPSSIENDVVADALQFLYRAAHGPKIETSVGAISIAPAVDPSLKGASFALETRSDLLTLAERRTPFKCRRKECAGSNHLAAGSALFEFMAGRLGSPECWPALDSKSLTARYASSTPPTTNTDISSMKNMPIHITPHNIRLSRPLMNFIQKKVSALSRFAGDVLGAEVVLRGKSGAARLFSVSARVALPGRDLQANAVHTNLHGAVNHMVARLARLARKRKTRLANGVRRPVKKRTKAWPRRHGFVFSP